MSQYVKGFEKSFKSTNDLSTTGQFCIAKVDTSNDESIVLAAASTDPIVGVVQNKPAAGHFANVQFAGTAKIIAGGTITRGDKVTSDASGHAVTTTTNKDRMVGTALVSAVAGDIFEVMLVPGFPPLSA